jgi:homoserine O-acetyltransferase/O-succinyltransferase
MVHRHETRPSGSNAPECRHHHIDRLELENGGRLDDVTVAYETWGQLSPDASNAVLVCHGWTGDAHAASNHSQAPFAAVGSGAEGWWDGVIGPGCGIDTNQWFVVCANVLGGCQGSTGPSSPHPGDRLAYGSRFAAITIRDMAAAQLCLGEALGITRWAGVVGPSMGGMVALELACLAPERVARLAVIATSVKATQRQIALRSAGRSAIYADPNWMNGNYYDSGRAPLQGLGVARRIAQVTFRSDEDFEQRFGGTDAVGTAGPGASVEHYLDYHAEALVNRFDAGSYVAISKAIDSHDIGRGRDGVAAAAATLTMPTMVIGIRSDELYSAASQQRLADTLSATYLELDAPFGHDSFLIETSAMSDMLRGFLPTRVAHRAIRDEPVAVKA